MNIQDVIKWFQTNEVDGETIENIIREIGMEEQMLRQLIMGIDLSKTIDVVKEKIDIEYQNIKQHLIKEEGLDEEDMNEEENEDYINSEAKETFNQTYGLSYDDWQN